MIAAAPPRARRRDEDCTVLVVRRVRNRETRWRRSPSAAAAPRAGAGGRGVASPAPEPSLGLASHVSLERLVSGLRAGRLHDNDNGVRMRCGRIRSEIEKI